MNRQQPLPRVVTIAHAAELLTVSVKTLHRLIKEGKVQRVQISERRYGVSETELNRIINGETK